MAKRGKIREGESKKKMKHPENKESFLNVKIQKKRYESKVNKLYVHVN